MMFDAWQIPENCRFRKHSHTMPDRFNNIEMYSHLICLGILWASSILFSWIFNVNIIWYKFFCCANSRSFDLKKFSLFPHLQSPLSNNSIFLRILFLFVELVVTVVRIWLILFGFSSDCLRLPFTHWTKKNDEKKDEEFLNETRPKCYGYLF